MKKRRKSVKYARWIVVIIVCFTVSCTITAILNGAADRKLSQLAIDRMEAGEQVTALKEELAYVRSDAYVERVARDEFGLIMPGEVRYVTN